jgi:hypothetical protein
MNYNRASGVLSKRLDNYLLVMWLGRAVNNGRSNKAYNLFVLAGYSYRVEVSDAVWDMWRQATARTQTPYGNAYRCMSQQMIDQLVMKANYEL